MMPAFAYQALAVDGSVKSGSIEAADRGDAVRLLARRGLQARSIQSHAAERAVKAESAAKTALNLSKTDVIRFTEDMGDLLASGLQVEQALQAMENRSAARPALLAERLRELVRDGVPLSTALGRVSPAFDELYCNMIAAGENSGALDEIMDRQARHLRLLESIQAKVTGALIYPAFLIASGGALTVVMVMYLLPKLAGLLAGSGKEPPVLVRLSLALSEVLRAWWLALLILLLLVVVALFAVRKSAAFQSAWHRLMLRLPGIRSVTRARFELQFFETLGSLLRGGVPLLPSLELVHRAMTNLHLKQALTQAEEMVKEGASLSWALKKTHVLESQSVDVIRIGEDTGQLAAVLGKAAARMDMQLTRVIERITALIQPCLLLLMAVLVGGLVWTMVSIVFSTLSQLNH